MQFINLKCGRCDRRMSNPGCDNSLKKNGGPDMVKPSYLGGGSGRIIVTVQLRQKVSETPSQSTSGYGGVFF
jgi:hypothetical protein